MFKVLRSEYVRTARLAQSVERKTLNLVVVGSSPTVGIFKSYFSLVLSLPSPVKHSKSLLLQKNIFLKCLFRLAVRTSRCGRDNPGSNPGRDTSSGYC